MKSDALEYSTSILYLLLTPLNKTVSPLNKTVCTDTSSFLELLESSQDALFPDTQAFNLLGKRSTVRGCFLLLILPSNLL